MMEELCRHQMIKRLHCPDCEIDLALQDIDRLKNQKQALEKRLNDLIRDRKHTPLAGRRGE